MPNVRLNIMLNKLMTERIGTVEDGVPKTANGKAIYADVLDKLWRQTIPCRPISPLPVRAPAEAPAGE